MITVWLLALGFACSSQKVILIKSIEGKPFNIDNNVYAEELVNKESESTPHIVSHYVYGEWSGDDRLFITDQDSIYLSASSFISDPFNSKKKSSIMLVRNIQCFPYDTIVISDLRFTQFTYKRTLSIQYSWKDSGDTAYRTKPLRIKHKTYSLAKSIPYPKVKVQDKTMYKHLRLQRSIGTTVAFACSPPRFSYEIHSEIVNFLFVLDLIE